jgi:hypothetical protein
MRKSDELKHPDSCTNRALGDEMVFVLLARDEAAPATLRFWANERVRLGKNSVKDEQYRETMRAAATMERQRAAIRKLLGK